MKTISSTTCPTGGRGGDKRSIWRHLDLVHDGRTFLRRRGFDLRIGGVLLHRIDAADPGMDLHDHPWRFVSIVLRGGYTEEAEPIRTAVDRATAADPWPWDFPAPSWHDRIVASVGGRAGDVRVWRRWSIHSMPLDLAHRITAVEPNTVTLVIRGRKVREWGFYVPPFGNHVRGRWVPWTAYDYASRRPVAVTSNRAGESMPEVPAP